MKQRISFTKNFKKALKKLNKSGSFKLEKLEFIIEIISNNGKLPIKFKDHELTGDWTGYRECHVEFDLLLIYEIKDNELILVEIGNHSELFG
jgi:mRNA interferase YafQ